MTTRTLCAAARPITAWIAAVVAVAGLAVPAFLAVSPALAQPQPQPQPAVATPAASAWLVTVEGDARPYRLLVDGILPAMDQALTTARYGSAEGRGSPVAAELRSVDGKRQLLLTTPAGNRIVATENAAGGFDGTLTTRKGTTKAVALARSDAAAAAPSAASFASGPSSPSGPSGPYGPYGPSVAGTPATPGATAAAATAARTAAPDIHIVYMGGNDCPPCVAWRAVELPKLRASAAFQRVRFTHVEKTIPSAVPPRAFLPEGVRPYKQQLDAASGGHGGSAQVAILVDGVVYDYYYGSRSAGDIEAMVRSIVDGTRYPFRRCVKRGPLQATCDTWG